MNINLLGWWLAAAGTCTLWPPFWSTAYLLSNKKGLQYKSYRL